MAEEEGFEAVKIEYMFDSIFPSDSVKRSLLCLF